MSIGNVLFDALSLSFFLLNLYIVDVIVIVLVSNMMVVVVVATLTLKRNVKNPSTIMRKFNIHNVGADKQITY